MPSLRTCVAQTLPKTRCTQDLSALFLSSFRNTPAHQAPPRSWVVPFVKTVSLKARLSVFKAL